jgi:hypothetical protein
MISKLASMKAVPDQSLRSNDSPLACASASSASGHIPFKEQGTCQPTHPSSTQTALNQSTEDWYSTIHQHLSGTGPPGFPCTNVVWFDLASPWA